MKTAGFFAFSFLLLVLPLALEAQPPCDPHLRPATRSHYPYGPRGNRCEGLYELELANSRDLPIVGLMVTGPNRRFRDQRQIRLLWASSPQPTTVRANSLRIRTYYRLDVAMAPASRSFTWPALIPAALGLERSDIGLLAWRPDRGAPDGRLYVPVALDSAAIGGPARRLELILMPEADFVEVRFTLHRLGAAGVEVVGYATRDVGLPYYVQSVPIRIPLSEGGPLEHGDYQIEVTARRASGGSVVQRFRFRHARLESDA